MESFCTTLIQRHHTSKQDQSGSIQFELTCSVNADCYAPKPTQAGPSITGGLVQPRAIIYPSCGVNECLLRPRLNNWYMLFGHAWCRTCLSTTCMAALALASCCLLVTTSKHTRFPTCVLCCAIYYQTTTCNHTMLAIHHIQLYYMIG